MEGRRLVPQYSPLIAIFLLLALLVLPLTLSPLFHTSSSINQPPVSAIPSSFSWTGLRTDTVAITYSVSESIYYGGTGYLHIDARPGQGTYSDTRTATATITVPEGLSAVVYVCGDDHNPIPGGWTVEDKNLNLYVDGKRVYWLGREYWWAKCYSKASVIGPGTHEVKLTIAITVNVSSFFVERDLHYAAMEMRLEGSGTITATTHSAEANLDGKATHFFSFNLPLATGVRNMSWRATWNSVEKTGNGAPGSTRTVMFEGVNRDQWFFTSPVVIRVGEPAPSVDVGDNYVIDAVYDEGSEEAGVYGLAVALNNGDEVGFTSAKYLVTEIRRETKVIGGTLIGSAIWANSNSTILFNQTVSFYDSTGWVTEKIRDGVETGSGATRIFGELNVSRVVGFSSKNRSDELELTTKIPQLTLVFTHIKISAERNGNNVNARACWAHDNTPIAGLRVGCFETGQSSVTDLNGFVSFTILGSGFRVTICPLDSLNGIAIYEEARVGL